MNTIGILKEPFEDKRVCLLPEAVKKITNLGVRVVFESRLGDGLNIPDKEYINAGAQCYSIEKIYEEADVICSINHRFNGEKLIRDLNFIGIFNPLFHIEELSRYNQFASIYSLDLLPRSTIAQNMDVLSSMASLAGYKALLLAANYSNSCLPMFTTAAGTIKPAKVLILGAGVAGLQAIATAKRMGAIVEAFDVRSSAEEEVRSLGAKFIQVEGSSESSAAGGYAVIQSEDFQNKQQNLIHNHAIEADIIISTANIPGRKAPLLLKKHTVEQMKKGSVIIDLASEQGGNCELTQNNKTIQQNGVTIIGNSHLSRTIPEAASRLLSNNFFNYISLFIKEPNHELIKATQVIKKGQTSHPKLQEKLTLIN